ncbi:MAG TPA: tail fiber domain-containing protein [Bacteroidales bacterium]|nr:tail fiber domain-containing protein [Bacteroidales bacterium]HRW85320.1 tail fiber domain-containing protein [Bacteroidales bacterium]
MKTKLSFFVLFLALSPVPCALSQTPQGFNYQAVARDAAGISIVNTPLPVRITIQADSLGTTILWQELHEGIVSNSLGMISLVVGKGARQTSSTLASFADIDWSVSPKFIRTDIDYSGWKTMGVSRLWSVPYSMVAGNLAGSLNRLSVQGETLSPDDALFEVKNRDGQIVFAVFNEGVRVYVSDGEKGIKGGFAVGGFGTDKQESQKYLMVTRDSTRIYVNDDPSGKKVKGGFAVGGFDATKDAEVTFTSLTPQNYFIGHLSGSLITSGVYNSVLGYESGINLTEGGSNSFIGYRSGYNNSKGSGNLFLGYETGYSNTEGNFNTFLGYQAGRSNKVGVFNSYLGSFSGFTNNSGNNNTFVGDSTGYFNLSGSRNTFLGTGCGLNNSTGEDNVFIGSRAGVTNTAGFNNVFIGNKTGYLNEDGFSNVIIGINAGYRFKGDFGNTFIGDNAGAQTVQSHKNVFLGAFCGYNHSESEGESFSNVFIGNGAGYNSPLGSSNVFIGFEAGFANQASFNNVMIGFESGHSNAEGNANVFIGSDAGYSLSKSFGNTFIGTNAGRNSLTGDNNLFLGESAGMGNLNGELNVVLGSWAGAEGPLGNGNVLLGMDAGRGGAGNSNVYIGNGAGSIYGGDLNIFLGHAAGVDQKGSGYFIVDSNSGDSTQVLLFGNFFQDLLRINGKVGIGTHPFDATDLSVNNPENCGVIAVKGLGNPWNYSQIKLMSQEGEMTKYWEINHRKAGSAFALVYHDGIDSWRENLNLNSEGILTVGQEPVDIVLLDVRGNGQFRSVGSGEYLAPLNLTTDGVLTTATSDARLKTNISTIPYALDKVLALRGVNYNWLENVNSGKRIGFLAQEVEEVLPEVVFTNPVDGYKGVNYAEITALLTEAIKEQQKEIEELKALVEKLMQK